MRREHSRLCRMNLLIPGLNAATPLSHKCSPMQAGNLGFHQMEPVLWQIEAVYPLSSDGKGSKEKIYQVSAYTPRYHSWVGGTWTPWNTGMPWEEGKIEIFNARVTIPEKGLSTHASQYFIFTYGAF